MRRPLKALVLLTSLSCITPSEQTEISQTDQAIIGGITDQFHPYVVGVGDQSGPFCTGTVISRRTVVTAGHCFGGITRIFFGTNGFNPTAVVNVAQEIRHPQFNNNLDFDVAILRLSADAPGQYAPLLRETMNNTSTFIGPDYTFVGYGVSNGVNQTGFGTKRVTTFPIEAVGPANVGGTPGSIGQSQFYYAFPNRNTCNGDSGGPAFIIRSKVERHAGVTSFGDGPCTFDGVQARTDTLTINNFIQAQIDSFEAGDPCRNNGVCDETCNTNGQVKDPDCHANHCGDDNLCSLACVLPVDPDCTFNFDLCGRNGMCNPDCSTQDPDCAPLCGQEGTCIDNCGASVDPDCGATPVCGNGVVEAGEQCDDGNQVNTDACKNTCQNAVCGDGIVRTGTEQCDDGNQTNTDACTNACQNARCGDTFVQPGETCDDGNTNNTDACTGLCQIAACGDGFVRAGTEQCDDGNNANGDGCSSACTTEGGAVCGNGVTEAGEQCDDSNNSNADACTNVCQNARCGDGFIRTGVEQCDDGNANNGDGCSSACTTEGQNTFCGDGILQPGEQCDDGNIVNFDGCRNTCVLPLCGDQLVDDGEECDDGNGISTDACVDCVAAVCGDGIIQSGIEECDDSNTTEGDGCDASCLEEINAPPGRDCSTNPASNHAAAFFMLLACFGLILISRRRIS